MPPPQGWEELRGDRRCGRAVSVSSACCVILSYTKGPGLASAGPRPQVLPLPSVSQPRQVMKVRLPQSLPECLGSQRHHCEWPAFIFCTRLARLTTASLGPEDDARSGVCCQGFSYAIPVNSDSPQSSQRVRTRASCARVPSLWGRGWEEGAAGEWKVSRSGLVAWPPRAWMFHKVIFQGRLPPLGLGNHASSPELRGLVSVGKKDVKTRLERMDTRPQFQEKLGVAWCCGLGQSRQAAHSFLRGSCLPLWHQISPLHRGTLISGVSCVERWLRVVRPFV